MSAHNVVDASQKFTCPTVTGVAPAATVAVSVTTLPNATEVVALSPELNASVVVVAVCALAAAGIPAISAARNRLEMEVVKKEAGCARRRVKTDDWRKAPAVVNSIRALPH
jgi:hypothetical protein